jgi:hypothetical protein
MLVSRREAVRILRPVVRGEAQARSLLASGLAGEGVSTGLGKLYDDARVRSLLDRPLVDEDDLVRHRLPGLYVARLARDVAFRAGDPWPEIAAAVSRMPEMPPLSAALLGVQVRAFTRLPWVATVAGYIALGADLVGFERGEDGTNRFVLQQPGAWWAFLSDRRFPTRPGGRPWHVWMPPPDSGESAPRVVGE